MKTEKHIDVCKICYRFHENIDRDGLWQKHETHLKENGFTHTISEGFERHPDCQLAVEPFFQCCCQCVSHIPDHHHHSEELHKKGECFKQKGWICLGELSADGLHATSQWPEHSCGCEVFIDKNKEKIYVTLAS